MNINIKEIFKSDLDPNSTSWWSKDKIDKINFNFNQFLSGGMPGPQGFKGADGDYGYSGAQGYQGFMGVQGYQGPQGFAAPSEWIMHIPTDNTIPAYLFPKVNQTPGYIEQMPAVLKTGYIDPLNESPEDFNGSVKTVYLSPIIGGLSTQRMIGLRLQHLTKVADFRIGLLSGNLDMEIGRIITGDPGFHYLQIADEIIYEILGVSYLKITSNMIRFGGSVNTNFTIEKSFSHNAFKYNRNAQFESVLISNDTDGNVKWVDKKEIFGSFPVGSIISIREEDFNSTNFILTDNITQTGPPYGELQITFGKGRIGTEYEGWYLCHGQTWKVANGVNEFQTPNLSSFNYSIESNEGGQNLITNEGDNTPIIIGGSDISMEAIHSGNGIYDLNLITDQNDTVFQGGITGNNTNITRMIHIVFLDNSNLYWSDSTFSPPPPSTSNIILTNAKQTSIDACVSTPSYQYTWTGLNNNNWNTFNHINETYYLYNYGTTTFATPGWYKNIDGITRYWNGSAFISYSMCEDIGANTVNLMFGNNVYDINGAPFSGDDYEINTTDLSTAAQLYTLGTGNFAPLGWYRDSTSGIRRYWNGSLFIGTIFTEDYVIEVPEVAYNTSPSPGACSISNTIRSTYIEMTSNQFQLIGQPMGILDAVGFILYTPLNWANEAGGFTPPLVNIISQNAPGTSLKYRSAFNNFIIDEENAILIGKTYGIINQVTGELDSIGIC